MTRPPEPDSARIARFREARRDPALVVLEGIHPLKHAVRFDARLAEVAVRDRSSILELAAEVATDLGPVLRSAQELPPETFDALAPRPPATGVIAIAHRRGSEPREVLSSSPDAPVVLLENPSRLGNLGAVVRVAAAAGVAGVLAVGEHDPWSPEAIRGGAGLQFALPTARADRLPETERPLVALVPDGVAIDRASLPTGAILAFGNERTGLSRRLLQRASLRLSIPMRPGVSSLNLATAVAVMAYRWRLGGTPGDVARRR